MISENLKKRLFTSIALLFSIFLIFNYSIFLIYFLFILGVLSILEFIQLSKKIFNNRTGLILINFFFIFYIFAFCYMFFFFSNFKGLKILLYIFLLGCIASDIGGFIFGKIFKGPRLTKISPNKTYAGALGSITLTLPTILFLFYYFTQSLNIKILVIALMTSIFCQLGDLLFSYLKRKAKVKDTGNILPGHGGVLDRLDGIIFAIPISFLTLVLIN